MIEIRISRFSLVLILLIVVWLIAGRRPGPGTQAKPVPATPPMPRPSTNGAQLRTWDTSGTAQEAAERGDAVIYGMVVPALENLRNWSLN